MTGLLSAAAAAATRRCSRSLRKPNTLSASSAATRASRRQQRRFLSATAASSNRPRIISRRALEHHLPRNPSILRPVPPRTKRKDDDTAWPLAMRVAGYTALALTVPYIGATMIATSDKVRDRLEGDRPDVESDKAWGKTVVGLVRKYWGALDEGETYMMWLGREKRLAAAEWARTTATSSSEDDSQKEQATDDDDDEPHQEKTFEAEIPHRSHLVRSAQVEIERLRHTPIKARITLNPEGEMGGCVERTLQGDVPAEANVLRSMVADAGIAGGAETGAPIAVDFVDEDEPSGGSNDGEAFSTTDDAVGFGGDFVMVDAPEEEEHPAATALRRLTWKISAWHYDPSWETLGGGGSAAASSSASAASQSSSSTTISQDPSSAANTRQAQAAATATTGGGGDPFAQMRLRELDAAVEQLSRDLRDPRCTKDLDDVREELKRSRAEARQLRGGWGGAVKGWFGGR